jgi:hypothetical protein
MKTLIPVAGLLAATMFLECQTAPGQVILSPVGVTESGLGTFSPQTAGLTNIINGSGLENVPFVSGVTGFDAYFTPNDKYSRNADGTKWQSVLSFDVPLVGHIDFDLGASYQVNKIAVWNVSVKDVTVVISDTLVGLDTATPAGTFTLTQNTGSVSLQADILNLGTGLIGRYVRFAIASEYKFGSNDTWYYATLGEVAMSAIPAATSGPPLSVALQANGDVKVTFTGTLQAKANVQDTFQNVSGNPQSTYTIPKASLGPRQFFRSSN